MHDELPWLGVDVGVGVKLEDALGGVGADGLLAERGDTRRRPAHEDADGSLETFLTLSDHLEIKDTITDERGFRLLDLQGVRSLIHDGDRQLVFEALIVDGITNAHDVVGATHLADDLVVGILGLEERRDDGAAMRGIGRGLEYERHTRQVARRSIFEELHARRKILEFKAVVTADAVAGEVLEQHHAATLGHGHELAVAGIVDGVVGGSERQARLRGDHLDTVNEVGSAALQVVSDADRVDAVDRSGDLEAGIQTAHTSAVIVADERSALGRVDIDDGIEGRTEDLGEGAAFEDLPLLEWHTETIDVARLLDDAIESVGLGLHGEGALLERFVWLGLKGIVDGREAEEVARRRGRLGLRVEDEFSVVLRRQNELLREGIARLEETHGQLGAELATGGVDRVRASEIANVQAVIGIGGAAVGRLADHHVVITIVLRGEGTIAVLSVQNRVVREGLLKLVLVENGDVRIECAVGNGG